MPCAAELTKKQIKVRSSVSSHLHSASESPGCWQAIYDRVLSLEQMGADPLLSHMEKRADTYLMTIMEALAASQTASLLKAGSVLGGCMSAGMVQPQLLLAVDSQLVSLARMVGKAQARKQQPLVSNVDERWATVSTHAPLIEAVLRRMLADSQPWCRPGCR